MVYTQHWTGNCVDWALYSEDLCSCSVFSILWHSLLHIYMPIECEIDSVAIKAACHGAVVFVSTWIQHGTFVVNAKTCSVSSRSYLYPPMPTSVSHFSDMLLLPWPLLALDTSPVLGLRYSSLQIKAETSASTYIHTLLISQQLG